MFNEIFFVMNSQYRWSVQEFSMDLPAIKIEEKFSVFVDERY